MKTDSQIRKEKKSENPKKDKSSLMIKDEPQKR
jgi:hypothetical protein